MVFGENEIPYEPNKRRMQRTIKLKMVSTSRMKMDCKTLKRMAKAIGITSLASK